MQRWNTIIISVGALAGMVAVGFGIAWAMSRHDVARDMWHVVHLLIAFKVLKWIGAGCLLVVMLVARLVKASRG